MYKKIYLFGALPFIRLNCMGAGGTANPAPPPLPPSVYQNIQASKVPDEQLAKWGMTPDSVAQGANVAPSTAPSAPGVAAKAPAAQLARSSSRASSASKGTTTPSTTLLTAGAGQGQALDNTMLGKKTLLGG